MLFRSATITNSTTSTRCTLYVVDLYSFASFYEKNRYWSHVLGHEGEGSLHAVLQAAGLVEDLSAGLDLRHDDGAAFRLAMTLTELGEENLNEVLL